MRTNVVVIGAGAVGCAVARELSKYKIDVVVVDKNEDIGGDASKSNSAIIHTGYDASPGTLESQLVVAAIPCTTSWREIWTCRLSGSERFCRPLPRNSMRSCRRLRPKPSKTGCMT